MELEIINMKIYCTLLLRCHTPLTSKIKIIKHLAHLPLQSILKMQQKYSSNNKNHREAKKENNSNHSHKYIVGTKASSGKCGVSDGMGRVTGERHSDGISCPTLDRLYIVQVLRPRSEGWHTTCDSVCCCQYSKYVRLKFMENKVKAKDLTPNSSYCKTLQEAERIQG